jgi:hypothetical protein
MHFSLFVYNNFCYEMIRFGMDLVTRIRSDLFDVFPLAREFLNSHEAHYRRTDQSLLVSRIKSATREAKCEMRSFLCLSHDFIRG